LARQMDSLEEAARVRGERRARREMVGRCISGALG
jgi:hypothetical protein